ncbi:glutamate racemase [Larsenimonas suaedae]|uniref:Glutamate racemase n=1 Tax=Larsenimonas suaedae TaxID=1851019 RepID=A0ABU1GY25_9GAMM|nr:glutamate racemase [Larsenimonas suaedae]MCM2972814.1 glutamate racemase [Larsenimonas suaedae]MDR5896913.1 glutamate racemase [Larsenimonas suaedae]
MANILVFDSGMGGWSVLEACRAHVPGQHWHYLCDNAALPYGTKPDAWLTERILAVVGTACAELRIELVIIACNTASTLALEALRARLSVPVIGTVPAIKPAAEQALGKPLALLATSATLSRRYTQTLIERFSSRSIVHPVNGDALVSEAESFMAGDAVSAYTLKAVLAPLQAIEDLHGVVLGCTHFPLLTPQLRLILGDHIIWYDSGAAIARRVEALLPPGPRSDAERVSVYATDAERSTVRAVCRRSGLGPPCALKLSEPCLMFFD